MLDAQIATAEFRHRVANDLALISAVVQRRRRQPHVLSTGEVLDEVIDAITSLALLYRQMHDRNAFGESVDIGQHIASISAHMERGYLSGLGIALFVRVPTALTSSTLAHDLTLIVVELVANAAKHSQARNIGIELSTSEARWSCCVVDDGIGLPDAFCAPPRGGIHYVGRLAAALNGRLTIASQPGAGSSFKVCFPAPAREPQLNRPS